jgi:CBS domain-containing protein
MSTLKLTVVNNTSLPVPGMEPWQVDPRDPALSVMTDFRERSSVTVPDGVPIDDALEHMKHTGVRSAFVTDDLTLRVVGLITAYDIASEKPMQQMQIASIPRQEVLVRDIMQKIAHWRVADIAVIERSTAAEVAAMFAETGLTHVPVVEPAEGGGKRLRGLLSAAKVKRLLSGAEYPTRISMERRPGHGPRRAAEPAPRAAPHPVR